MSSRGNHAISISHDRDITLTEVSEVGAGRLALELSRKTALLLSKRRSEIVDFVKSTDEPSYGFNRGFGHNVKLAVGPGGTRALQDNLIVSHACGVGESVPEQIVRATMLLRAQSLARGFSGVRPDVVQQIIDFLNAGVSPLVPRLGSVSASGDLAPLSHIAYGLTGRGRVFFKGKICSAASALRKAGISPLDLDMKEGLALNNGVQYTTAIGAYCVEKMEVLLKTAAILTSLSTQVMLGADTPFRADLHDLRRHIGAQKAAQWIFDLMRESPIREAHRDYNVDGEIQDPYNIRCAAQILGSCITLLDRAHETLTIEANSVTDNPIILKASRKGGWDKKHGGKYLDRHVEIVSGGHFHGMPVAVDIYGLLQAMGICARLSNMRCARFVDENRNKGLGSDLKWPGPSSIDAILERQATSSGMMIPEYTSAALTNWIWGACMPSHLFSISTDAGQEDHVSMGANVAVRVLENLPRLAEVLAMELAFVAQGAAIRKEMSYFPSRIPQKEGGTSENRIQWSPDQRLLSKAGESVLDEVYKIFPVVTKDRFMSDQLQMLSAAILEGKILSAAQQHVHLGNALVQQ